MSIEHYYSCILINKKLAPNLNFIKIKIKKNYIEKTLFTCFNFSTGYGMAPLLSKNPYFTSLFCRCSCTNLFPHLRKCTQSYDFCMTLIFKNSKNSRNNQNYHIYKNRCLCCYIYSIFSSLKQQKKWIIPCSELIHFTLLYSLILNCLDS